MDGSDTLALGVFLAANLAAASSGAIFRPGGWYERIRKPTWRPPNWLFGPAWALLFLMIATAGWMVWREGSGDALTAAMNAYAVQLALNAAWSGVFFGLRRPGWALFELILLWIAIAATIVLFLPISETAAWLMTPYLAWVSFAGALNAAIWRLNRGSTRIANAA